MVVIFLLSEASTAILANISGQECTLDPSLSTQLLQLQQSFLDAARNFCMRIVVNLLLSGEACHLEPGHHCNEVPGPQKGFFVDVGLGDQLIAQFDLFSKWMVLVADLL